jgi:uncharacterized protein
MEPQTGAVAPGWYPDPTGALRWWDGGAWGPLASGVARPPQPNKALAVISHLGPIFGGFILPLVIYLAADKNDRYVHHHASEGLNFQLTYLIVTLGGLVLFFATFAILAATAGSGGGVAVGVGGFVLVWLLFMALAVVGWVFAIIGAIHASQGKWWRYPICIRFVPGAVPEDTPALVGL